MNKTWGRTHLLLQLGPAQSILAWLHKPPTTGHTPRRDERNRRLPLSPHYLSIASASSFLFHLPLRLTRTSQRQFLRQHRSSTAPRFLSSLHHLHSLFLPSPCRRCYALFFPSQRRLAAWLPPLSSPHRLSALATSPLRHLPPSCRAATQTQHPWIRAAAGNQSRRSTGAVAGHGRCRCQCRQYIYFCRYATLSKWKKNTDPVSCCTDFLSQRFTALSLFSLIPSPLRRHRIGLFSTTLLEPGAAEAHLRAMPVSPSPRPGSCYSTLMYFLSLSLSASPL